MIISSLLWGLILYLNMGKESKPPSAFLELDSLEAIYGCFGRFISITLESISGHVAGFGTWSSKENDFKCWWSSLETKARLQTSFLLVHILFQQWSPGLFLSKAELRFPLQGHQPKRKRRNKSVPVGMVQNSVTITRVFLVL